MTSQAEFYFNTTSERGAVLADRKARAAAQDAAILALYRRHGTLGPWQVHALTGEQWPITSVRRAINTLTRQNKLVKLDAYRMGPEGAREHLWALPVREVAA